jgi:hypothetical protein
MGAQICIYYTLSSRYLTCKIRNFIKSLPIWQVLVLVFINHHDGILKIPLQNHYIQAFGPKLLYDRVFVFSQFHQDKCLFWRLQQLLLYEEYVQVTQAKDHTGIHKTKPTNQVLLLVFIIPPGLELVHVIVDCKISFLLVHQVLTRCLGWGWMVLRWVSCNPSLYDLLMIEWFFWKGQALNW